ncbi:hypothetical protein [Nostoc sp. MG11]|uniref:hypothetical protein n=1 Tax=Nostoc sp. MG11 TaxID=2721166 RepID=UPI001867647C|nr:hypothetical protein [Nostoc sp. MG11]
MKITDVKILFPKIYSIAGLLALLLILWLSFGTVKTNLMTTAQASSPVNLAGNWDYKPSIIQSSYQMKISNQGEQLIGTYINPSPNANNSIFEIRVYESGRGRPVITIAQIAKGKPNSTYRAALSGRLDSDTSINGNFVDVDNNKGTFTMNKR